MTDRVSDDRIALLVHEVRSPTAALAAIAAVLADGPVDDDALRTLIGLALAAARGIEHVVAHAAVGPLELGDADVGQIARESVAGAALTGARIRLRADTSALAVHADPLRLRQAVDNLVANALAHVRPEGEVVVHVRKEGDVLLLSVTDDGEGIPFEEQERIFEPGVRLDRSRPGFGLGLAVARAIVESHGGRLMVESAPGQGATFTIALGTS
jgi:signal transduction histidine kinase